MLQKLQLYAKNKTDIIYLTLCAKFVNIIKINFDLEIDMIPLVQYNINEKYSIITDEAIFYGTIIKIRDCQIRLKNARRVSLTTYKDAWYDYVGIKYDDVVGMGFSTYKKHKTLRKLCQNVLLSASEELAGRKKSI